MWYLRLLIIGEMTEWLKVLAWKVSMPQKGIVGSNPAFSAKFFSATGTNNEK